MAEPTKVEDLGPYAKAGWDLIPLHRFDDKHKGREVGKAPRDAGWRRRQYPIKDVLAHLKAGSNAGVRLRPTDLVLDVDPRNFPEGRDCLAELVSALGLNLDAFPHVLTGSGGHHYYMKKDPQTEVRAGLPDFPGVEFKTSGVQVVAAGSVHPNGRRYRWDDLSPSLDEAPLAPERLLGMIRRASRPPTTGGGELTTERLEELLALLDPKEFRDHDRWLRLMMACHHATDGAGMDEFLDWSATDPEYSSRRGENAKRWDSLHGQGGNASVTVGTLYRELIQAGHQAEVPREAAEGDFPDALPQDEEGKPRGFKSPLHELNQTYWAVDASGKFRVFSRVDEPVGDGASTRKVWRIHSASDFMLLHGNRKVELGKEVLPLGKAWLEWQPRRTAHGVVFDPTRNWPGWLNLWQGFAVEPRQGDWSLTQDLILNTLCGGNQSHFDYVMDWLAHCVQHPGERAEVALVFRGDKGTGKGTLGRAMRDIFGVHGLHISSPGHLTGRFNAHLRDCVLMFADEAFWAGDKASESVLKQLITESTMMYEQKGIDARSEQNHIHIIIASNEHWVVPAGINGERRFCILDALTNRQGDRAYFNRLNRQLRDGGLEAMLFDLLARDLAGRHPRENIPVTTAMTEQKTRSLDPVPAWWLERLHEGTIPTVDGEWQLGPVTCLAQDLQTSLESHLRAIGARQSRRSVGTQLGQELRLLIPSIRKVRATIPDARMDVETQHDRRAYAYVIPSLKVCRNHFADRLLQDPSYDWTVPVESDADDLDFLR